MAFGARKTVTAVAPTQISRDIIIDFWNAPFWPKIPDKPSTFPPSIHGNEAHSPSFATQTDLFNHVSAITGVHGVGAYYIAKTSRSDQLPSWGDIPDKPSAFPPASHGASHGYGGSDPLPARSISRTQLEYPTVDVTLGYLASISKLVSWGGSALDWGGYRTVDDFTDKAVEGVCFELATLFARQGANNANTYKLGYNSADPTMDFEMFKAVNGTATRIGYEAIDLPANRSYLMRFSVSGSTLKGFRDDLTTPKISVTDTTFASGGFGAGGAWNQPFRAFAFAYILKAPTSSIPSSQAVVEYPVIGKGTSDDPIRPNMPEELVEIDPRALPPDEANAVQANPKGPNGLPMVNRLAVTWGAIDYKGGPTMVVAIYPSTPSYVRKDNVLRHIEFARGKNLFVDTGPFTLDRVRDLYRKLKTINRDMLITDNELAYQLIGAEELEIDAAADFYEREVINLRRIDPAKIVDFDKTIDMWLERGKRFKRDKALEKLSKVKKI